MSTTTWTHNSYTLEIDGHEFNIPWPVLEDTIILKLSADGLTARLGSLSQDEDPEDPFEGEEGEFFQFDPRKIHHVTRPEPEDFKRIIRANPGRVFTVDCYEHSDIFYKVADGPFTVEETKDKKHGDYLELCLNRAGGYYIAPEDVTDPAKHAESALKTYSSWCNGDVYGVCVWTYTRATINDAWGEPNRDAECWGFIGYDYASQELDSQMED